MGIGDIQRHQCNTGNFAKLVFLVRVAHGGDDLPAFDVNSFAVARPKSEEAPVMKIAFCSRLFMQLFL
jgi:hypothetical protein